MIVPGSANPLLMAQAGDPLDELGKIERSVRLRPTAAARFERTPAANGNQKKWTLHVPVKRSLIQGSGSLPPNAFIFGGGSGVTNYSYCGFANNFAGVAASDTLEMNFVIGNGNVGRLTTNRKFRDPAAHYIMTFVVDTAQATASDRLRIYIDGTRETVFSITGWPAQNADMPWLNSNTLQSLGALAAYAGYYFDGYLSQVCFVDGQALDPSAFGQIHPRTGQWRPKTKAAIRAAVAAGGGARNGWGTNGFLLPFDDATSLTTLGYDRSQSDTDTTGNNWTAVNISLTAGVTYDSMPDTPTRNFCTLNPLANSQNAPSAGLLEVSSASSGATHGTQLVPRDRPVYWEIEATATNHASCATGCGVVRRGVSPSANYQISGVAGIAGFYSSTYPYVMFDNGTSQIIGAATTQAGDIMQVAINGNNGWIGRNDIWFDSAGGTTGNPATGANPTFTISSDFDYVPFVQNYANPVRVNFGQRAWSRSCPAGFGKINTKDEPLSGGTVITSGSFTGNLSADGPFIACNGCPETLTINGNAVDFGVHADRLANGFKLRTASSSYNASGTNNWSATVLSPQIKSTFRYQNAKGN